MSPILLTVSSDCDRCANCRSSGVRLVCRVVPMFRSKNRFAVPAMKIGPVVILVVALLLIAGVVALAVIEPRPPVRHFEVPVPSERFAR